MGGIIPVLLNPGAPKKGFDIDSDVDRVDQDRWRPMMLEISQNVLIPENEIEISAIRAQGAGGQNVNKVSSAIHLRFNIRTSSLPDFYKAGLLKRNDRRITNEGVIVIKAQRYRSQEQNKEEALKRLRQLIKSVSVVPKKRRPTKPTDRARKKGLLRKASGQGSRS